MSGTPLPPPDASDRKPQPKRNAGGLPTWAWVLIVGGVAVALILAALGYGDSEPSADDQRWTAHAMCADFTRDRLKSPGSADFPEYDDRGVTITAVGDEYIVRSFVDADNSFGASIRTSFTCTVTDLGDQWLLEDWSERP